jgi:6-pyruvoyltetrahydropterin/6-carboxytetrahydropterin synthase
MPRWRRDACAGGPLRAGAPTAPVATAAAKPRLAQPGPSARPATRDDLPQPLHHRRCRAAMSGAVVITKRIEWDMGHRLGDGYAARCRHAHGHRYAAELTFAAEGLDRHGMILDFEEISRICKAWIDAHLDHAFLVCRRDHTLLQFLRAEDNRHCVVDFNTTVEHIAPWLAEHLQAELSRHPEPAARGARLVRLRLFETPTAWAEWRRGG